MRKKIWPLNFAMWCRILVPKIRFLGMYIQESMSGRVVPIFQNNWLATFSLRRNFGNRRSDVNAVDALRRLRRRSSSDWCSSLHASLHPWREPSVTATSALRLTNEIFYRDNSPIMIVATCTRRSFKGYPRVSKSVIERGKNCQNR